MLVNSCVFFFCFSAWATPSQDATTDVVNATKLIFFGLSYLCVKCSSIQRCYAATFKKKLCKTTPRFLQGSCMQSFYSRHHFPFCTVVVQHHLKLFNVPLLLDCGMSMRKADAMQTSFFSLHLKTRISSFTALFIFPSFSFSDLIVLGRPRRLVLTVPQCSVLRHCK